MSILDKFLNAGSGTSLLPVPAATKAEPTPAPTPATGNLSNSLAAKLASLGAPASNAEAAAKLQAATKQVALQAAVAQSAQITKASIQVPEGLLELDEALLSITDFPAQKIQENLARMYMALETDQADIATLCKAINDNLRQYEELSYLLKPEQINLYLRGLMLLKNVNIAAKAPSKSAAASIKAAMQSSGGLNFDIDI